MAFYQTCKQGVTTGKSVFKNKCLPSFVLQPGVGQLPSDSIAVPQVTYGILRGQDETRHSSVGLSEQRDYLWVPHIR